MYSSQVKANAITADFRSDTVTRPTPAMRQAMLDAEVGDDVYRDDPSVNALQQKAAQLLGKEAALFMPSGTQSNLAAVMAHCNRGEECLVGQDYHINVWEAMGTAVLGSVACHPLPVNDAGGLDEKTIRDAIKPDDWHKPQTRLLSIENTKDGMVQPLAYMDSMAAVARDCGLKLHCDGARLMNAVVATGSDPARFVEGCDSVSLCLSKGLGAPVGSVLVGDAETINRAGRIRKMLGGGLRQAGVLAAAAIHALDHHVDRLDEDHRRAATLATRLNALNGISVDTARVHTNMVFARFDDGIALDDLEVFLADRGVAINPDRELRLVTHLDLDDAAIDSLVDALAAFTGAYAG